MSAEAGSGDGPPMSAQEAAQAAQKAQAAQAAQAAQKRLQHTQAQVDEVVDIMRVNVEKVLERDQKLSELDDRADALQDGASQFEKQAGKLKNKFWLQNCKMIAIMVGIGVIIIGLIVDFNSVQFPATGQEGINYPDEPNFHVKYRCEHGFIIALTSRIECAIWGKDL